MANRYRELLRDARGQLERALIPDAQLEAEYLLAHACLCSRQQLRLGHLSQAHGSPTKPEELCFLELLALRTRRRVPLAQLLQVAGILGLHHAVFDVRHLPHAARLVILEGADNAGFVADSQRFQTAAAEAEAPAEEAADAEKAE